MMTDERLKELIIQYQGHKPNLGHIIHIGCDSCDVQELISHIDLLQRKLDRAIVALNKIDDPIKNHHYEEDHYTRAACFQFVTQEALKEIGGMK